MFRTVSAANGAAMLSLYRFAILVLGLSAMFAPVSANANSELELADRGTVPSCSITDALPPELARQAAQLGFSAEQLMPSTVTRAQFGGRLRCAKTIDVRTKGIGIALVEDFVLDGTKVRALYQGDTVLFSLSGGTPAATYPMQKGEFRCYRGGAAAVMQCTTGFGAKGASVLTLQNQNEDYLLGLSISAYDWPDAHGMPTAPVVLQAGTRAPVSASWVNQSLADPDDAAAWTAIFEGKEFTDALLKQEGTVPVTFRTQLGAGRGVNENYDYAEMIALYKAMAALTREMLK